MADPGFVSDEQLEGARRMGAARAASSLTAPRARQENQERQGNPLDVPQFRVLHDQYEALRSREAAYHDRLREFDETEGKVLKKVKDPVTGIEQSPLEATAAHYLAESQSSPSPMVTPEARGASKQLQLMQEKRQRIADEAQRITVSRQRFESGSYQPARASLLEADAQRTRGSISEGQPAPGTAYTGSDYLAPQGDDWVSQRVRRINEIRMGQHEAPIRPGTVSAGNENPYERAVGSPWQRVDQPSPVTVAPKDRGIPNERPDTTPKSPEGWVAPGTPRTDIDPATGAVSTVRTGQWLPEDALMRVNQRRSDYQQTLDQSGANLAPAVRDRLTKQVAALDKIFSESLALHDPDAQKRIKDSISYETTTTPGAAARSYGTALAPAAAAMVGGSVGSRLGAMAPGPWKVPGTIVGGLVGALGLPILTELAQRKGLEALAPEHAEELERLQATDAAQHPAVTEGSNIAAAGTFFRMNPLSSARGLASLSKLARGATVTKAEMNAAKALAVQTGFAGAVSAGQPLLQGRAPTWSDISQGGAQTILFGEHRFGGHGAAPEAAPAPPPAPSPEGTRVTVRGQSFEMNKGKWVDALALKHNLPLKAVEEGGELHKNILAAVQPNVPPSSPEQPTPATRAPAPRPIDNARPVAASAAPQPARVLTTPGEAPPATAAPAARSVPNERIQSPEFESLRQQAAAKTAPQAAAPVDHTIAGYESREAFQNDYQARGQHEHGESEEEFLQRVYCSNLGRGNFSIA